MYTYIYIYIYVYIYIYIYIYIHVYIYREREREIDALGSRRAESGGSEEHDHTLNQLLALSESLTYYIYT